MPRREDRSLLIDTTLKQYSARLVELTQLNDSQPLAASPPLRPNGRPTADAEAELPGSIDELLGSAASGPGTNQTAHDADKASEQARGRWHFASTGFRRYSTGGLTEEEIDSELEQVEDELHALLAQTCLDEPSSQGSLYSQACQEI